MRLPRRRSGRRTAGHRSEGTHAARLGLCERTGFPPPPARRVVRLRCWKRTASVLVFWFGRDWRAIPHLYLSGSTSSLVGRYRYDTGSESDTDLNGLRVQVWAFTPISPFVSLGRRRVRLARSSPRHGKKKGKSSESACTHGRPCRGGRGGNRPSARGGQGDELAHADR